MSRKLTAVLAFAVAVAATASPALAETGTGTLTLSLTVPVLCRVSYSSAGAGESVGEAVNLGQLKEFCNAGSGYNVVVDYSPGSLRGAVLQLGDDRVVLDGSGEAVLSYAAGPRIRTRQLLAIPGENGFDTSALTFQLRTAA
jgi:hypothetical protein